MLSAGTLKNSDYRDMEIWGRKFAKDNDLEAFESAAEYYAAATDEEKAGMWFSFEEGVRNNTRNMSAYYKCMDALRIRAVILASTSEELGHRVSPNLTA